MCPYLDFLGAATIRGSLDNYGLQLDELLKGIIGQHILITGRGVCMLIADASAAFCGSTALALWDLAAQERRTKYTGHPVSRRAHGACTAVAHATFSTAKLLSHVRSMKCLRCHLSCFPLPLPLPVHFTDSSQHRLLCAQRLPRCVSQLL